MKAILITILCTVSTLLSAQTIDFDEVTFTKYATVMSKNDAGNPSAWRDVHNGKFTVSLSIIDEYRLITIANVTSGDLGIESLDDIPYEDEDPDHAVAIVTIENEPITTNGHIIINTFNGMLYYDFIYIGFNPEGRSIEEMEEKLEHIFVALYYASETDTIPYLMTINVGSDTYPYTVFYNDTANDSANRPSQGIKPSATSGSLNGHEWVDLGLSVLWATCNVGASNPSDYGGYYAWGETTTKSSYTEDNSRTYEVSMGDISGNPQYDAATANWGSGWRMPTEAELEELEDKCDWEWTRQGGSNGYKVTGPNGNSIFLPAAGRRDGTSLYNAGVNGGYCGSSPLVSESDTLLECILFFYSGYHSVVWDYRYYGGSVRPVSDK